MAAEPSTLRGETPKVAIVNFGGHPYRIDLVLLRQAIAARMEEDACTQGEVARNLGVDPSTLWRATAGKAALETYALIARGLGGNEFLRHLVNAPESDDPAQIPSAASITRPEVNARDLRLTLLGALQALARGREPLQVIPELRTTLVRLETRYLTTG